MSFLQLIRFKNLVILALVQALFSWVITAKLGQSIYWLDLLLLIQATVLLAAAGNVINDFFDVVADTINKPSKVLVGTVYAKKTVLHIYTVLNFFGIASGVLLAYLQDKVLYALWFVIVAVLLFMYSKFFKKIALLGNLMVSFLIALSVWLLVVFPPFHTAVLEKFTIYLIGVYGVFAFSINLLREIVKDMEDMKGDYSQNVKSLPILIGIEKTQTVVFMLSFIPFAGSLWTVYVLGDVFAILYFIVLISMPLGYFMYQIRRVKTVTRMHTLSTLLKLIMLFGILSISFLR